MWPHLLLSVRPDWLYIYYFVKVAQYPPVLFNLAYFQRRFSLYLGLITLSAYLWKHMPTLTKERRKHMISHNATAASVRKLDVYWQYGCGTRLGFEEILDLTALAVGSGKRPLWAQGCSGTHAFEWRKLRVYGMVSVSWANVQIVNPVMSFFKRKGEEAPSLDLQRQRQLAAGRVQSNRLKKLG